MSFKSWYYTHLSWRIWRLRYRVRGVRDKLDLARRMGLRSALRGWRAHRAAYTHARAQYGDRAKRGRLEAFAETGTEGFCWMVLEDGKTGYESLIDLANGDHLIIFFHDGTVAFDGIIDHDREAGYQSYPLNPAYGQPCAFGCWIHWTQRGWTPEDWAAFFFHSIFTRRKDKPPIHPLLDWGTDRVPYRAVVVKSDRPETDEDD